MKPVHAMSVPRPQKSSFSQAPVITDETRRFVNQIFIELQASFTAWKQTFPTNEALAAAKVTWMKALVEARIVRKEQIAQGLRVARQCESDFFPSPGKFISWCKTAENVPDIDTAFGMLNDYIADHQIGMPIEVRAMFDLIDRTVLRTKTESDLFRVFKRNYRFVCGLVNSGQSIDEYLREPLALEHSESFEQSEERRLRVLDEISKTRFKLGLKR
ncbi:replication protein P [Vibrio algivorus]|nr:replication protein P [Vibrio algivorus]